MYQRIKNTDKEGIKGKDKEGKKMGSAKEEDEVKEILGKFISLRGEMMIREFINAVVEKRYKLSEEVEVEVVRRMLQKDSNCLQHVLTPKTYYSATIFRLAASKHVAIMRLLIQHGLDVHFEKDHQNMMHWACSSSNLKMIDLLLEQDLRLDVACEPTTKYSRNERYLSPLELAAEMGQLKVLKHSASKKISLTQINNEGWSLLHFAVKGGHIKTVKYLISVGLDLNAVALTQDKVDRVPITLAIEHCHLHVLEYLIESGAKFDITASDSGTIMHFTARRDKTGAMIYYLHRKGVAISTARQDGQTPLEVALRYDMQAAARVLMHLEQLGH
jgi:hypothetical protein